MWLLENTLVFGHLIYIDVYYYQGRTWAPGFDISGNVSYYVKRDIICIWHYNCESATPRKPYQFTTWRSEVSHFCQMMQQFHWSMQLHNENIFVCFFGFPENTSDIWFWLVSSSRGSLIGG